MSRPTRARIAPAAALFALLAGCATSPKPTTAQKAQKPVAAVADSAGPEAIFQEFRPGEVERIVAVQQHVDAAANEYDLEPELIYGVIWVESRFQPKAKSPAGARGLMQLMPQTAAALAKQMGVGRAKSYDPAFNVRAGSYYLRRLLDRYDGDEALALAAYHAGAGNVNKWMKSGEGLPDFSQKYVASVFDARARFRGTPLDAEREQMLAVSKPAPVVEPQAQPDPPKLPPKPVAPPEDELENYEPVFEVRPDLDANPPKPAVVERRIEPKVEAPRAEVAPGPGVLPGVGD